MTTAALTSVLALVLLGLACAFQSALALGVAWGAMAYGGRAAKLDDTLPIGYRVMSALIPKDALSRPRTLLRLTFTSVGDGSVGSAGTVELALQASASQPWSPTL